MKKSKGFILAFFGIFLVILLGVGGLSIDIGSLYYQRQVIQSAADTAALAAVLKIHSSDNNVRNEANAVLAANNVETSAQVNSRDTVVIQCGNYNPVTKIFTKCSFPCISGNCPCANCQSTGTNADEGTNAVQVQLTRVVPSFLAKVFNITSFRPSVSSVAAAKTANSKRCVRPFGIEKQAVDGVSPGSTFTIGSNSPGNWGRLNFTGGSGGSSQFEDDMMNGQCDASVSVGSSIPPYTGNANSIDQSFNNLISANQRNGLVFALTSPFGNGKKNVSVLGFAVVDFISQTGNGNGWQATFRLVASDYVIPPFEGGSGVPTDRYLTVAQ